MKILCRGFSFGKCLFTSLKNIFPTFVFTFKENGGLNHITFLLRFFFSEVSQSAVFVLYVNLSLKPLFLSASASFKERFRGHKKEFTHKKYRNSTELSKYIWQLEDANMTPTVTWKVVAKVFSDTKINFCKLCLTE